MSTSDRAGQWLRTRRHRLGERDLARNGVIRAACAVVAAGAALTTASLAGAAVPATAATHPPGQTVYNIGAAGYVASGRWFRFASTTLTVPPRIVPTADSGDAIIKIHASCPGQCGPPFAEILVEPGGGPRSVYYQGFFTGGPFKVSPQVGDRLTVSIYYDRNGHDYFTATDLTQHTTQTVELRSGGIQPVYDHAELLTVVSGDVPSPAVDRLLWKFTGTRLTTYTGVHGTVQGPWQLTTEIGTTDGTASGAVVISPSAPRNGGQDFGIFLRHR